MRQPCHICGQVDLRPIAGYSELCRVASDCRPFKRGGHLYRCPACGAVQKRADETWQREIAEIYRTYQIYFQGEGIEQAVFDQADGAARSRSASIATHLDETGELAADGRLLDIGCGNGAFLKAFHQVRQTWRMTGTELGETQRKTVEALPGVEGFHVGSPQKVPGQFDLISMIHVLEHIPDPIPFLRDLRRRFTKGGLLFIEVPNAPANPFDILIADHCSHFSAETLRHLLTRSGYRLLSIRDDWVAKELSLLASPEETTPVVAPSSDWVSEQVVWLREVVDGAKVAAKGGTFGLFGTSIAAAGVFAMLEDQVEFFVDEDPNRAGRAHFDKPVYHPKDLPRGATVYLPLPTPIAEKIAARLARPGVTFVLPPPLSHSK